MDIFKANEYHITSIANLLSIFKSAVAWLDFAFWDVQDVMCISVWNVISIICGSCCDRGFIGPVFTPSSKHTFSFWLLLQFNNLYNILFLIFRSSLLAHSCIINRKVFLITWVYSIPVIIWCYLSPSQWSNILLNHFHSLGKLAAIHTDAEAALFIFLKSCC